MVRTSATDWEQWTYASNMESHDHVMFSGINASPDTELAGITMIEAGYSPLRIAPQIPANLRLRRIPPRST